MSGDRLRDALDTARDDLPVGVLAALGAIGGSYAVTGWTDEFLLVPIDQAVVTTTPAPIVNWTILNLGEAGHLLHQALATVIALVAFGAIALAGRGLARGFRDHTVGTVAGGVSAGLLAYLLTGSLLSTLATAVGLGFVLATAAVAVDTSPQFRSRRQVVVLTGVVAGFLGLSYVVGQRNDPLSGTEPLPDVDAQQELIRGAHDRSLEVDGLEPLVSRIGEFYNVDISSAPSGLDADEWTLRITGAVENEVTIDYETLTDREPERRFVTLRCVSDPRNGRLMDTALWTGVPVAEYVEEAVPESGCGCVMLRAADGYYERFPVEALRRTFVAYGMNGRTLPPRHGAPVRVLVPGHWGEINVKWITEIEILEAEVEGFWEERGWHGTGPVKTVAKLSAENRLDDGRVEVAGHAYAGTRGVSGVEVSTDGGETWTDAELGYRLPGEDVWRQWRYAFEPSGEHEVVVRAIEDDGTVQPSEETDRFPSGASGWVRTTITE